MMSSLPSVVGKIEWIALAEFKSAEVLSLPTNDETYYLWGSSQMILEFSTCVSNGSGGGRRIIKFQVDARRSWL